MAGRVRNQHQGHAALSRRESFKVSQVVHQRLARGPSGQGFGSHATQAMAADDLHRFEEDYEAAEVSMQMLCLPRVNRLVELHIQPAYHARLLLLSSCFKGVRGRQVHHLDVTILLACCIPAR